MNNKIICEYNDIMYFCNNMGTLKPISIFMNTTVKSFGILPAIFDGLIGIHRNYITK